MFKRNKSVIVNLGNKSPYNESVYRYIYDCINLQVSGYQHNKQGKLIVCPILDAANILFLELYQLYYKRTRKNPIQPDQSESTNDQTQVLSVASLLDLLGNVYEDQTEKSWVKFQDLFTLFNKKREIIYSKLNKDKLKDYLSQLESIRDRLTNSWLTEESFKFSECIKECDHPEYLQTDDEITVIFQPPEYDNQFWQNNFDCWQFFNKYPNATFAFGQQEYREIRRQPKQEHKVRILVFISEESDIDYKEELETINSLKEHGAEIHELKSSESSKEDFKQQITNGYDALIFIGHSQTEGTTGKFYLKQGESLTIEELNETLKLAIQKGLRLAIFNSCDGMGLGSDLSKLHIDNVIVMKTDVTNEVAEHFLRYFLEAFAKKKCSLPMAVKQAKNKLSENLEPLGYPCVSELPILWINAGTKIPLTWNELRIGTIVHPDWGNAPDINEKNFWGREKEQEELKEWIVKDNCKVVTILGLPGIGKTGLAVRVAKSIEVQQEFDFIIWRSLLNAPQVDEIITDVINFISYNQANILDNDLQKKINELLKYLKDSRCLIILDNADTIIEALNIDKYKKGYESYAKLFQAIAESSHNSCLLLTTRKEMPTLKFKISNTGPVRLRELYGLNNEDAKQILNSLKKDCIRVQGNQEDFEKVIIFYDGNPLALNLIGRTVIENFAGDISEFIEQQENKLFKQKITDSDQIYREKLDSLADYIFQTLSNQEKELMYWLGINLDPVSYQELSQDFLKKRKETEIKKIVKSLENKIALFKSSENELISLQPVVVEYMIDNLINEVVKEIHRGEIQFLNSYALFKTSAKDSIKDAQIILILNQIYQRILPDDIQIIKEIEKQKKLVPPEIADIHQQYEQILTILKNKRKQDLLSREKYFHNILSHIRANESFHNGYAAGNLLNILLQCHQQEDFSNYDFSGLTIRHGYFLERNLHNINFNKSTFEQCIFTQIFSDIYSLKISSDGQWLVFGDSQSQVKLWKLGTNEPEYSFIGHQDVVWSVDISSDKKYIASSSEDSTIILWDINKRKLVETFTGHKQWVYSVAFSHNNKYLASGSEDSNIILWDVKNKKHIKTFSKHQNGVWSVAFSPDDKYLASGSDDGTIILWDIENLKYIKTFSGHQEAVRCVVFSPDGKYLATASEDGTIIRWKVEDGNLVNNLTFSEHMGVVTSVAFGKNSTDLVSSGDDATVKLRHLKEDEIQSVYTFNKHKSRIRAVAFTPNNKYIVSGAEDKTIRIWSLEDKKPVRTISGHTNQLLSVAFNPDGDLVASSSEKYKVKLWNIQTGEYFPLQGHHDWVWAIAFNADGKKLASVSEDQIVKIWDVNQRECIGNLEGHEDWIWTVAFHPINNQILATAGAEKKIFLWHLDKRTPHIFEERHTDDIWCIAFSPDGNYLASASHDGTIGIWSVETKKLHYVLGVEL